MERKLKSLGIDSDFKIYLSFFNFKNLPKKSVADFGYDPSSPIFFVKKKAGKIIILRDEKDSDNLKRALSPVEIIPLEKIKSIRADVLKFDYSISTRNFFDDADLNKYSEWIVVFDKNKTDSYDYEVKTRLMSNFGGKVIGSKNNDIVVWGKISKS